MEIKFGVFKVEDANKYLSDKQKSLFVYALNEIYEGRKRDGKGNNSYIVVNMDEPYIDDIIGILKTNGHWG